MRATACFADGRPGVRVLLDVVDLLRSLCIVFAKLPSVIFRRIVDKEEIIVPTSSVLFYSNGGKMVTLEDARRVIAAAEKKAKEIGQPMNIAVADEGGNLVSHVRMDGAWLGSIDISIKKAYTSRAFDIATKDLATHSQSGGQFFGIHASNDGKIMIFAGGIPLKKNGKVVGAIGVSGGSGEQDHAVAEAGAAAF
jgi:uncharacterized protein GlcG (DUF336 family)